MNNHLPDAMQPPRRESLFLLGCWSVMLGSLCYMQGKKAQDCGEQERQEHEKPRRYGNGDRLEPRGELGTSSPTPPPA
jgi:hypothetical protein